MPFLPIRLRNFLQNHNRLKLFATLALSSLFCLLLLAYRMNLTGKVTYIFLVWNLFLAWIPYGLSIMLAYTGETRNVRSRSILLLALPLMAGWLLFLPNSPYILTDIFHLKQRPLIPLWYDLIMLLSFAWTGAMLGFISLTEVQRFVSRAWNKMAGWVIAVASLGLCAFGIYLGRFLRWNSWDVASNPYGLVQDITDRFIHPLDHGQTTGVTLTFTAFLLLAYLMLRFLMPAEERKESF